MATLTSSLNSGYYINDSIWPTMYVYGANSTAVVTYYYTPESSFVAVQWLGSFDTVNATGYVSQVNIAGSIGTTMVPISSITPTAGLNDASIIYRDIVNSDYTHLFSYIFSSSDSIYLTNYDDKISSYSGNDLVYGYAGNDNIEAGYGFDTVYGGTGNDYIQGGFNGDQIFGEDGNDDLRGGNGLDLIVGGVGNDTIRGARGNDTLSGGDGSDVFIFATELNSAINVDTIVDFVQGTDRIELSAVIFSNLGPVGSNVGLSQYLTYDANSGQLSFDADGSGAGVAVAFAVLGTTTHPTALGNDFWIVA